MSANDDAAQFLERLEAQWALYSEDRAAEAQSAYFDAVDSGSDEGLEETLAYATLLIAAPKHEDIQKGLDLLNGLLMRTFKPSECALLIAQGHFRRGEYKQSRQVLTQLLLSDPSNQDAALMLQVLKDKVWQAGPRFALYAGVGAGVALLGLWLWRRSGGGGSASDLPLSTSSFSNHYGGGAGNSYRTGASGRRGYSR